MAIPRGTGYADSLYLRLHKRMMRPNRSQASGSTRTAIRPCDFAQGAQSMKKSLRLVLALLLAAASAAAQAQLTLRQPTVASGGGLISSGPLDINATIGEPAVSQIAIAPLTLYSGFQATIPDAPRAGSIHNDGFEAPVPPPAPATEGAPSANASETDR